MGLIKLFSDLLEVSSQEFPSDEPPKDKLQEYLDNLDCISDIAHLKGPFLPEQVAIKEIEAYRACLFETVYAVNCRISRHLCILCDDILFDTRDNARVEFGINPFNHRLGLHIKNEAMDFDVLEIDDKILLNPEDRNELKHSMTKLPLTNIEIKHFSHH